MVPFEILRKEKLTQLKLPTEVNITDATVLIVNCSLVCLGSLLTTRVPVKPVRSQSIDAFLYLTASKQSVLRHCLILRIQ